MSETIEKYGKPLAKRGEPLHAPTCHYDAGYCDGLICWERERQEEADCEAIALLDECPDCGQPCDGGCRGDVIPPASPESSGQ